MNRTEPVTPPATSGSRFPFHRWVVLLGIVILIGTIWFVVRRPERGFDWALLWKTLKGLDLRWFAAALAMVLLSYVGRAIRWRIMILPLRPHPRLWGLFTATAIGFTAVVLFGRAGELVRPYLISKQEKVPLSSQVAVWLLERIYDLLSVLLLFGFALSRIHSSSTQVGPRLEWILRAGGHSVGLIAAVCFALLGAFALLPDTVERRLSDAVSVLPANAAVRLQALVKTFVSGTSSTRQASFVLQLFAFTLAEWAIIVLCFLCVFRAFPSTSGFGLLDALIIVGFVAFGSALQIPGVGGGMQIATIIVLTELFHLPIEVAGGIAILLWVVAFASVVPIGLLLAFHEGLQFRRLMRVPSEMQ